MIAPSRRQAPSRQRRAQLDQGIDAAALAPFRVSLSKLGNRLSRLHVGRVIADPLTGFFVIRREAFLLPPLRCATPALSSCSTSFRRTATPAQRGAVRFRAAAARQIRTRFLHRLAVRHLSAEQTFPRLVPASLISFLMSAGVACSCISPCFTPRLHRPHARCRRRLRARGGHQRLPAQRPPYLPRQRVARHQAHIGLPEIPGNLVDPHPRQRVDRHLYLRGGQQIAFLAALAGIALDAL